MLVVKSDSSNQRNIRDFCDQTYQRELLGVAADGQHRLHECELETGDFADGSSSIRERINAKSQSIVLV